MRKAEGKILIQSNLGSKNFKENILKTEEYLNNEIASIIYNKFQILIRVHVERLVKNTYSGKERKN